VNKGEVGLKESKMWGYQKNSSCAGVTGGRRENEKGGKRGLEGDKTILWSGLGGEIRRDSVWELKGNIEEAGREGGEEGPV